MEYNASGALRKGVQGHAKRVHKSARLMIPSMHALSVYKQMYGVPHTWQLLLGHMTGFR